MATKRLRKIKNISDLKVEIDKVLAKVDYEDLEFGDVVVDPKTRDFVLENETEFMEFIAMLDDVSAKLKAQRTEYEDRKGTALFLSKLKNKDATSDKLIEILSEDAVNKGADKDTPHHDKGSDKSQQAPQNAHQNASVDAHSAK